MAGYGLFGTDASVAGTGADIGAGASKTFTWPTYRRKAFIQNDPASGAVLRVKFNGEPASLTDWDVVLSAGDFVASPEGLMISKVAIYADVAVTYKTDFNVVGWD